MEQPAPLGRLPGAGPPFFRRKGGKKAKGERFSPLETPLEWVIGFPCYFYRNKLACGPHSLTWVSARPPARRAGAWGGALQVRAADPSGRNDKTK